MARFGRTSMERLNTCHPDLVLIAKEAIAIMDFSIIEGARSAETQMKYFLDGKSTKDGVKKLSKHQVGGKKRLSTAMDIAPYTTRVVWDDLKLFNRLIGIIQGVAHAKGIKIRCGIDWTVPFDPPHVELIL